MPDLVLKKPVSPPHLPGWLARSVDDWEPGIVGLKLPKPQELRAGIQALEAMRAQTVTPAFARQCLAKLMVAFEPNTKLSAEETKMRAAVWLEANGDLPDELWAEGTTAAIKTLKWMPKPAEFRELVIDRIRRDADRLRKLERMLEEADKIDPAKPFRSEPLDVRLRCMRDSFRKIGDLAKAAKYECDLAKHEKRAPENWATRPHSASATPAPSRPAEPPKRELPSVVQAELLRGQAAVFRRQGNEGMALEAERQADVLDPPT